MLGVSKDWEIWCSVQDVNNSGGKVGSALLITVRADLGGSRARTAQWVFCEGEDSDRG